MPPTRRAIVNSVKNCARIFKNCNGCDAHGTAKFARAIIMMPVSTMKKSAISAVKFNKTGGKYVTALTVTGIVIGDGVGTNNYFWANIIIREKGPPIGGPFSFCSVPR